ncbi:hypothetical protein HU732_09935 [Pseudomonas proteolytica]|uniref:hypothetical protein n=1 Tax=Pseudomonas proteolytica TaxID=219574 RepID=UPI00164628A3|nr:hypothetical protein [Pseudomonas proteolytica]MBC3336612.1 hypothetical protein [Pseudomonas proteolytica]
MAEFNAKLAEGEVNPKRPIPRAHIVGTITQTIGTGDNAKNSIVWMTITWSFVVAGALSLLLFALVVAEKDFKYVQEIKSVWSVFIPLITLALGYAFGKNQ